MLLDKANEYVEEEVATALKVHFGADAVERTDSPRRMFSVFFDATGCFLIEIVAVGGGVDMINPEVNRLAVVREYERDDAA